MVEPLMEEAVAAAAPTATGEGCFADELVLFEFTSDPLAAAARVLPHQAFFFQDLFNPSVDCLPGLPAGSGGGGEEEEELEWLPNKDAFPELETSFEVPDHSLSSSSSGWSWSRGGATAAAGAVAEGASPFSPLGAAASFSAPSRPRSKGRTRRRTALAPISSPQPAAVAGARKEGAGAQRRRCRHCQSEETPQWRAGPKTLCNACGVRYKSGRLVPEYRPERSPTFFAAIHSNSHRRILEMRRQKSSGQRRRSTE